MADPLQRQFQGETAYHAGLSAEESVWRAYRRRGYRQLQSRWRGTSGEIDLILGDAARIVFVEVKKSKSFERAAASLSPRQIGRLFEAATEFLGGQPQGLLTEARFDLALVDGVGRVEIRENALMG